MFDVITAAPPVAAADARAIAPIVHLTFRRRVLPEYTGVGFLGIRLHLIGDGLRWRVFGISAALL